MAKSIMQDEKVCYVTGSTYDLHKHHVFSMAVRTAGKVRSGVVGFGCGQIFIT